jgi:hypothetical protein
LYPRYAISTSIPQMYVGISVALKIILVCLQTIRCRKILYSTAQTKKKKKYVSQSRRYSNLNHCLRGNFVCIYYCSSGTVIHVQNIIRNVLLNYKLSLLFVHAIYLHRSSYVITRTNLEIPKLHRLKK